MSLDAIAAQVLTRFSLSGGIVFQGNRGGFSGARLWQVRVGEERFCLRGWPATMQAEAVHEIHRLLDCAKRAGLGFVPLVIPSAAGDTVVDHAGRLWEAMTWLPGRADFRLAPSPTRLENACGALAKLHAAWAADSSSSGPCPAVGRRLQQAKWFVDLIKGGWRPEARPDCDPGLRDALARARHLLDRFLGEVFETLAPWRNVVVALQPCLCDLWHDHVLFEGEAITGLVDFGSVKVDHVAVDLARLLGSLVEDDASLWSIGLAAYEAMRPLTRQERELACILDRTGTIVGVANWLRWLFHENRAYDDMATVARRLEGLVSRLEDWVHTPRAK